MVINTWAIDFLYHGDLDKVPGIGRHTRSESPCAIPKPVSSTVAPVISPAKTDAGRRSPSSKTFPKALVWIRLPRKTPFKSAIKRSMPFKSEYFFRNRL